MLLDLLVCYNVHCKKEFIRNNFKNSFQYDLSYMYNFLCYWMRPHEHCFLADLLDNVFGGWVLPCAC